MKTISSSSLLTAILLGAFTIGCNKSDSPSASGNTTNTALEEAKSNIKNAASSAGEKIKETTEKAAEATKSAVQNAGESLKPAEPAPAPAPAAAATNSPAEAQGIVDKAKAYITEGKYKEGLASLKEASNYQLSPEQQKTVDDLKARAQKYLSSGVAKSISGLLQRTNQPASTNP
jgi:hypothetical protein